MYFTLVDDRLVIEAANPGEGFWLRGVFDELTRAGFDCRHDVKGDACRIQIPLRKRAELTAENA